MDDTELKALLLLDAPPARDFGFELAVIARIERRTFHRALWRNAVMAALAALALALLAPTLESIWQHRIAPTVSNLAIAALLLTATYIWTRFYAGQD